jgi:site-specific recombinase XerD
MNDFFKATHNFLMEYLPKQKCYSENTVRSYRQVLNLFISYLRDEKQFKLQQINFGMISQPLIQDFLEHLEEKRSCSVSSRNQRLMALRSFFKYAGMTDCVQAALFLSISDIPIKKSTSKIVEFLSETALAVLLNQPDFKKRVGLRNQFFMILMYDTAARCGELLNLKVRDLRINNPYPMVYLTGKGNKTRTVPLMKKTVDHCNRYLREFHDQPEQNFDEYVFYTVIHGEKKPMSADTAAIFMKSYGETAKNICHDIPNRVHPHILRHTRAMHLYRNGMPLALLAEYLGHTDPETTKIYAYSDTEMKRTAMEKADSKRTIEYESVPVWEGNEDLILKLAGLK